MKTLTEIRSIKEKVVEDLLKRPGVTGVDIGDKVVGGKATNELAIRVLVEQKRDVPAAKRIPPEIDGVKTDVIQRKFKLHPLLLPLTDVKVMADTTKYATVKGGISIGPCRSIWMEPPDVDAADWYITGGTLGAIVKDNGTDDPLLLSNFHVMSVNDGWSAGDTMCQPSRLDTGTCPADEVGTLQRAVLNSDVDCAVSSLTGRPYACEIVDIGKVAGTATAIKDMAVRKRGRTTGLTYGTVDTVDLSVIIPYGDGLGSVTLNHQIGILSDAAHNPKFGDHGDSGSVVVDNNRKVVGLYFAGSDDGYGVANPIQKVLDALNVKMCVPIKKLLPKELKDSKIEKREYKELKREWKELKREKYEIKEYDKDWNSEKGFFEGKLPAEGKGLAEDLPINPPIEDFPGYFGGTEPAAGESVEERLARLEAALQQPKLRDAKTIAPEKAWNRDKLVTRDKLPKERKDAKDLHEYEIPGQERPEMRSSLNARLDQLEAAVAQMSHFIQQQDRPDLSTGALANEPDYTGKRSEKIGG